MTATATTHWTVAYRKPRANRFLRVDASLTWDNAQSVAGQLKDMEPGLQVWTVPNAAYDAAHPEDEDAGNVLVDSGRRVAIKEGGVLPDGIVTPVELPAAADEAADTYQPGDLVWVDGDEVEDGGEPRPGVVWREAEGPHEVIMVSLEDRDQVIYPTAAELSPRTPVAAKPKPRPRTKPQPAPKPAADADDLKMEFQLTGPDGGTGYIRRGGRERNALIEFDGQQWSVCYAGEAEVGYGDSDALAAAALMREIGYHGTCSLTIVDENADWTRTTMIIDDEYGTRPEAPVADEPAAAPVARPARRRPATDTRRPGRKPARRAANKRARASRRTNRR